MAPSDVPSMNEGTAVLSKNLSHVMLETYEYTKMLRLAEAYIQASKDGIVPPIHDNCSSPAAAIRAEGGPERLIGAERSCTTDWRPSATLEPLPIFEKKKVKNACLKCHQARKACDENRPCKRCVDNGYVCAYREPVPRSNRATKSKGKEVKMASNAYPQNWGEFGQYGAMAYVNQGETASEYMNAESSATGAANWMGAQCAFNNIVAGGMYHPFGYVQGCEGSGN